MTLTHSRILSQEHLQISMGGVLLSIAAFPAMAAYEPVEDPFMADFPVVLSVTRLPQKTNELPASVTIIDRDMIDASGATEIAELFRLVPGFQVGHYVGVDGHRTSVSYHGNSDQYARRMQVLIDGRSVYLSSTGGVSWDDLPIGMNEIERIEMIRGPNGVTYGANSFQAVINIITLHAEATHGGEYSFISSGSKEYTTGVRVGGSRGALDYRFNLQYESSEGFDESIEFAEDLNDDSRTLKLNVRTDYQIGVNDSLNLSLGYTTGARQVGYDDGGLNGIQEQLLAPVHDQSVISAYQSLKFQHIISSEQELNLQIYHNVHNLENRYQTALASELLTSYGMLTFDTNGDGVVTTDEFNAAMLAFGINYLDQSVKLDGSLYDDRAGIELSHQFHMGTVRTVWGGELRQDSFRGYDWVGGTAETFTNDSQRLFFNWEWSAAKHWTVNIGDMVEKSDYMDLKHSPRLALNWDIAKQHYIRLASSRAWRSPSFIESELDYSFTLIPILLEQQLYLNSEELQPEQIDVKEIAFGGGSRAGGFEYELRLFQEDMRDILVTTYDSSLQYSVVTNDGESHVSGGELALTFYSSPLGSTIRMGYSKLHPSGEIETRYVPINIVDLVPEETLNILFSQKVGKGGLLGINFYHVSEMMFLAGDMGEGFSTVNLSYHHGIDVIGHKAKMSFIAQNLMGSYFDYEQQNVTKSQIYLGIKGGF